MFEPGLSPSSHRRFRIPRSCASLSFLSFALAFGLAFGLAFVPALARAESPTAVRTSRSTRPTTTGLADKLSLDLRLGARWCRAAEPMLLCDGRAGSVTFGPQLGISADYRVLPWLSVGLLAATANAQVRPGNIGSHTKTSAGGASWQVSAFAAIQPAWSRRFLPRLELGFGYLGQWVRTNFATSQRPMKSQAWSHRPLFHVGVAMAMKIVDDWFVAPRMDLQPVLPGRACLEATYTKKRCYSTRAASAGVNLDTVPTLLAHAGGDNPAPLWLHVGIDVRKRF